jgi:hypothetical protein
VNVRVEAAPPDHVAARRRHADCAQSREQRTGEQERRAHPAAQLLVQLTPADPRGRDANLVGSNPLDIRSDVREQRDHRVDVADAGHVRQRDGFVGEQARRENRQRAVLVPRRADRAGQRGAAFDDEGFGDCVGDCGRGHELDSPE